MSEPSDFTVVTWALREGGWRYVGRNIGGIDEEDWWETATPPLRYPQDEALPEMRVQYAAAHRPSLAERVIEAAFPSATNPEFDRALRGTHVIGIYGNLREEALAAVQKVLDEAGVGDE